MLEPLNSFLHNHGSRDIDVPYEVCIYYIFPLVTKKKQPSTFNCSQDTMNAFAPIKS